MDTKKVITFLESALRECKEEACPDQTWTEHPASPEFNGFGVGDIVKLNWRTENNIAKIIKLFTKEAGEVGYVDESGHEGLARAVSLTPLYRVAPLRKELAGISVGDVIQLRPPYIDQYREVVAIDPTHPCPYGVYVPYKDRAVFTTVLRWYTKEDFKQVFKFSQGKSRPPKHDSFTGFNEW